MICSLLIPSRNRPEALKRLLDSVVFTASEVEILVRMDYCDPQLQRMVGIVGVYESSSVIVGHRNRGYEDVQKMYTELAKCASGDWLFMLNDDAEILGDGWDKQLSLISNQTLLIEPEAHIYRGQIHDYVDHSPFPIFHRTAMRHFKSPTIPVDADIYRTLVPLNYGVEKLKGITFCHHRAPDDELDRSHKK